MVARYVRRSAGFVTRLIRHHETSVYLERADHPYRCRNPTVVDLSHGWGNSVGPRRVRDFFDIFRPRAPPTLPKQPISTLTPAPAIPTPVPVDATLSTRPALLLALGFIALYY